MENKNKHNKFAYYKIKEQFADFDSKSISQHKSKSQGIKPKPKSKSNNFEREV